MEDPLAYSDPVVDTVGVIDPEDIFSCIAFL